MVEQVDRNVEFGEVRFFGPRQALKDHLDGSSPRETCELRFYVGQDAVLRGVPRWQYALYQRCTSMAETFSTVSIAGLTPMSASPPPRESPE